MLARGFGARRAAPSGTASARGPAEPRPAAAAAAPAGRPRCRDKRRRITGEGKGEGRRRRRRERRGAEKGGGAGAMAGAMAGPHPKKPRRAAGPPPPAPPAEADEAFEVSTGPEDGAGDGAGGDDDSSSAASSGSEDDVEEGEGDDEEDDEDDEEGGEVDVTFNFFDPTEIDYKGLRALLVTYLDGKAFRVEELVSTVIRQVAPRSLRRHLRETLPAPPCLARPAAVLVLAACESGRGACLQSTVGTVVKNAEDLDPIGVLTVLSLRRYAALQCLQEIKAFLAGQCRDADLRSKLAEARSATYGSAKAKRVFVGAGS